MSAGLSIALQLFLPGVEDRHWEWVLALSGACVAWALFCLFFARPEEHGSWFWHVPATLSAVMIAALMASTGGSDSPARFYVFFLLFYACYFFRRAPARFYVAGCVAVALTPLVYDRDAVGEGYVSELIVLATAYVTLGWLIIGGKGILVSLREQSRLLALRDPLTDLPNRRALLEWLDEHMGGSAPVGMLLADLDGFKDVNTVHGYPAGDAVLCETSATLRSCVRADDFVARLGGDEFAVLTLHTSRGAMESLAERVLDAIRAMPRESAPDVDLTISIGWAVYPEDARTVDELIAAADVCVREVKLEGKGRALAAADAQTAA